MLATVLVWVPMARATQTSGLQAINALFKQGQYAQALEQDDAYIKQNPKDAQARFVKGLILTQLKKTSEAIAVFTGLTEDFPELPEPYNNLAVLYAGQGDYDKARNALEMAVHIQPGYAVAHANLGDLYAKMAAIAYHEAMQLDPNNPHLHMKLSLINEIFMPNATLCPGNTDRSPAVNNLMPTTKPAPIPAVMPATQPITTPVKSIQKTTF